MTSLERDLDRKTREEFNRFQAGCVEEKNAMELVNNAHLSAGESELRLVA